MPEGLHVLGNSDRNRSLWSRLCFGGADFARVTERREFPKSCKHPTARKDWPRTKLTCRLSPPNMKTLALGLLIAFSAVAQKIEIESDPSVDFSKFRTFAIRDGRLNSTNPSLNGDLVRKRLDFDIEKYLGAKGLVFAPSGSSDLNVRYTLGAVRKAEVETYPAGWRGWGTRVVRVPFTEGTLVIDLRDASTQSLVWRGIAREDKGDAAKVEGKLDDMVKKTFDKYPPKPPK